MMQTITQNSPQSTPLTIVLPAYFRWIRDNWFNLFIIGLLVHLIFQKDITIRFQLHDRELVANSSAINNNPPIYQPKSTASVLALNDQEIIGAVKGVSPEGPDFRANNFSNLTFILNPAYAAKKGVATAIVEEKIANCRAYVTHYAGEAQREMREHGIPASITLAQGLLESNAGDSRLARESNNHFGIKCRAKCRGCTCRNYTDDDIYDMFRVFQQPLQSYQEHSQLLTGKRYSHLLKLGRKNYAAWAHGLKKAGYATDKHYAEKLIRIIEVLELDRFDQ